MTLAHGDMLFLSGDDYLVNLMSIRFSSSSIKGRLALSVRGIPSVIFHLLIHIPLTERIS